MFLTLTNLEDHSMKTKILEEMLENLVNDNKKEAAELFHEYVVNKSRDIYEKLIESELDDEDNELDDEDDFDSDEGDFDSDEDDFGSDEDAIGGDPTDDLESDLDADIDDMGDKEPDDLFQDLSDIIDELQTKFDDMTGENDEEFNFDDDEDDVDSEDEEDEDFNFDDSEDDVDSEDEEDEDFNFDDDDEKLKDSFDRELATVKEYVEKIVPKMGDNGANTKSVVAGKNDMGGTASNIVSGGESKTSGTKGGLVNPSPKEDNAGNVNVPGGKASRKNRNQKATAGADGENTKSVVNKQQTRNRR